MKKLLIATAALAMVAGTAQAQSSVTVYGNLDVGFSTLDTAKAGVNSGADAIAFSNDSSSRLGFRGTEDLGGGLKANFALETGLSGIGATTAAATTLGSRAQWVELNSNSGAVRLGFQDTASRTIVNAYDAASATNVIGNLAAKDSQLAARFNGVSLTSARMSGFQVLGQLYKNTTSEDAKTDVKADGYALGANYVAGKFAAHVAMTDLNTTNRAVSFADPVAAVSGSQTTVAAKDAVAAGDVDTKTTAVGISYDLGVAKLMASYAKVDAVDNLQTANTTNRYSQRDYTSVGVQAPFGKTTAFAQYSTGSSLTGKGGVVGSDGAIAANAAGYDGEVTGYTVGARYAFSKRTYAYAIYGADEVNTSATAVTKRDQIAFGINHAF